MGCGASTSGVEFSAVQPSKVVPISSELPLELTELPPREIQRVYTIATDAEDPSKRHVSMCDAGFPVGKLASSDTKQFEIVPITIKAWC